MALLSHILHRLLLLVAFLLPRGLRWRLLSWPYREAHLRQQAALSDPTGTQLATLQRIIDANRSTEFGRSHAFDRIRDLTSFRARVPLRTYSELEPHIERHRRGESNVLVAAPLLGFAVSGGSRGRPKPLPVTTQSLEVWARAEALLAREALRMQPRVARGGCLHLLPCYLDQTSRTALPMVPMPVLAQDAGRGGAGLPGVLPHQLFSVEDEQLRFHLVLRLSLARRVSVLRAACPGTLIMLAEYLELLGASLLEDLASGKVHQLEALPESVRRVVPPQRPDQALASQLGRRLSQRGRLEPTDVWPDLSLLVCSTTGSSMVAANRLSDRFGNLAVMDPGYRAAEGIFTWSWREGEGGLPLLDGQFIEFVPAGDSPDAMAANQTTVSISELEPGRRYTPVLTGFNGMYRYLMDDVVEVIDRLGGVPRLGMVGRAGFRIKLEAGNIEEAEVTEAITTAVRDVDVVLVGYTAWLARPEAPPSSKAAEQRQGWLARLLRRASTDPDRPLLTLAMEPSSSLAPERARKLLSALEAGLRKHSPAYDRGRGAGELDKPCLILLRPQTLSRAQRRRLADGMSGAHAPVPVLSEDGWLVEHEDVELQV